MSALLRLFCEVCRRPLTDDEVVEHAALAAINVPPTCMICLDEWAGDVGLGKDVQAAAVDEQLRKEGLL